MVKMKKGEKPHLAFSTYIESDAPMGLQFFIYFLLEIMQICLYSILAVYMFCKQLFA